MHSSDVFRTFRKSSKATEDRMDCVQYATHGEFCSGLSPFGLLYSTHSTDDWVQKLVL